MCNRVPRAFVVFLHTHALGPSITYKFNTTAVNMGTDAQKDLTIPNIPGGEG